MNKTPAIGIDLGMNFSSVAVFQHGMVEIIANEHGNRKTPSVVAFTDTCRLIGESAISQKAMNLKNTVFDVKRLIGREFNDESVLHIIKSIPFKVVNENEKPMIEVEYKNKCERFSTEKIVAMILTKMKETAEKYLDTKVTDAVITVPVYFNDAQRQATKNAGEIAGLNVLQIINEHTAAAIAYGLDRETECGKNVLILELKYTALDLTILTIDNGVFDVKAKFGDIFIGGKDFDSRLIDYLVKEFKLRYNQDLGDDERAIERLRMSCKIAKHELSELSETSVVISSLFNGIDFKMQITRDTFEKLCEDLIQSTLEVVERTLVDVKINKSKIDDIVLIGGSTRIPRIKKIFADYFDGKKLHTEINPVETIAYGAAVRAAILNGVEVDVIPDTFHLNVPTLDIETANEKMSTPTSIDSPQVNSIDNTHEFVEFNVLQTTFTKYEKILKTISKKVNQTSKPVKQKVYYRKVTQNNFQNASLKNVLINDNSSLTCGNITFNEQINVEEIEIDIDDNIDDDIHDDIDDDIDEQCKAEPKSDTIEANCGQPKEIDENVITDKPEIAIVISNDNNYLVNSNVPPNTQLPILKYSLYCSLICIASYFIQRFVIKN